MLILRNVLAVISLISLTRAVPFRKDVGISTDSELAASDESYRLPKHVIPSHYIIKLWPIIEGDFTFTGDSSIKIKLSENAKNITLHIRDLEIDETRTTLVDANDASNITTLKPTRQLYDNKTDFFIMFFDALKNVDYTLNLNYAGKLHEDLNGFYRSSYINAQGKKVWLATTQFEPTWARRAFPCFDEPALKATFEISINHDKKHAAISNMMAKQSEPDNVNYDRQWTHFRNTPVMSTYLIAFVVSDFDYKSSEKGRFAVWSRPNAIHTGNYALEIGAKSLHALDNYTKIEHFSNIDKMDNFAIPQFRAGAMENWGIVTYRESALLFDENVTSTSNKQGIATVISHEFAHQWFGNLVSPLWWDYTWLNEGFANYFQYYITEQIVDNWRLMDQFVIKNLQETAFIIDDKEDQHPMNGAVNTPLEISAFFDGITYSKAGCVIRMISHVLTDEVFQKGLQSYLTTWKFKAATPDNLIKELVNVAGKDLKEEYLQSWVTQRGYPVVTVIRDHETGSASFSQQRFLTNRTNAPMESWFIPINYATQSEPLFNDTKPTSWLPKEVGKNTTITGVKKGWIILNKQQTGYYRVNYDDENWQLIIDHLVSKNYTDIHVLNRAQLLDDSFHLAQAGYLNDHAIFLKMSTYLKQEVDYVPWNAAFRAFGALNKALANTEKHNLLKLYILKVIEQLEKTVGYIENEKDDHVTKFNRINSINWACYTGSKNCLSAARKQLEDHINGTSKISTDLRNVILCSGIRTADTATWEKTLHMLEKSEDETERKEIVAALGCSTDSKILNSFLAKSIVKGSPVSPNDALKAVLAGNPIGINIAFDFIGANLKKIVEINKNETASLLQILNEIGTRMTTSDQVNKLKKFIETNKDLDQTSTDKALANALRNLSWIQKHKPAIEKFLDNQKLIDTPVTAKPNNGNKSSSVVLSTFHLIFLALVASTVIRIY